MLWLANCYFTHDSSGFPVLLPFFDAPSGGSFHPFPCYPGPPARTWRCPFHRCGVASPQTPTPAPESLPVTIPPISARGTVFFPAGWRSWCVNSSAPFRNCTEAFDTARASQGLEQAKVSRLVLIEAPLEARPEGPVRRTYSCGRRNEAT